MKAPRRRFNRSERVSLYLAAGGRCCACGGKLEGGWHADHIDPYARGGRTELANGQALCDACNLRKGTRMAGEDISRRPWQNNWLVAGRRAIELGRTLLVGNIYPGSGKTFGANDVSNELFRRGLINAVIVLVPRINLCTQYELDWNEQRWLHSAIGETMGPIVYRKNEPPLFRKGKSGETNFGYVTTYDSLVSKLQLHLDALAGRRFMLVLDEAQRLGARTLYDDGTQAAAAVLRLAEKAAFVQLVTGTPYRADGQRLVLASYWGPDDANRYYLNADVNATYLEGVREGYLRPFEATLCDAKALREFLDGESENLRLAEMESGFAEIIEDPKYWQPLVDLTIERVREVQNGDIRDPSEPEFKRLCGLIGACRQRHAVKILEYLHSKKVSALLAVSDEKAAADNLRQFKEGDTDILVTVAMAHVGYDHKPISVVTCLNHYREWSWLDQFAARGMRMMAELPRGDQLLHYIGPNDRLNVRWADAKRRESDQGLRERRERPGPGPDGSSVEPRLSAVTNVELGEKIAIGLEEANDLDYAGFRFVDEQRRKFHLGAASVTGMAGLFRAHGVDIPTSRPPKSPAPAPAAAVRPGRPSNITEHEWERRQSARVNDLCKKIDARLMPRLPGWGFGDTGRKVCQHFQVENWRNQGIAFMERAEAWLREDFIPANLGDEHDALGQ